jgi:hypothetical protein
MASFTFDCPACGQNLETPNDMAGMELACPSCSAQLRIPSYDPQGDLGPATLVDAQPTLEPPQHPVKLKLKDTGAAGGGHGGPVRRRATRGRASPAYPGGGIRYSGWRTDSRPARRDYAPLFLIPILLIAGIFLYYKFDQKRKENRRAAATRARLERHAPAQPPDEEKITPQEEEWLREEAAKQRENKRLAREHADRDKEYTARRLFLEHTSWSSEAGETIDAKLTGYGETWVVLETASGNTLAIERNKLSARDRSRLEDVEAALRVCDPKWDDYARDMAARREEP